MADYLSTFRPLCFTAAGRRAAERYCHPPFVDASCRREPDFESEFPSISTLCHGDLFAPRLWKGDRVMFLTVKRRYDGHSESHWRAVAALEVIERFGTHKDAAEWYRARGLPLPSNCMVSGSESLGLDHTAHPKRDLRKWELGYWARVRRNGTFLAWRALFRELVTPPVVTESDLVSILRAAPATRNPPEIRAEQFERLLDLARQRATLSTRK